jgi:alpha-methylacyl-CoA racemase
VVYRHGTGRGQAIDISMTDGMIAFNAMYGASFLVDGKDLTQEGTLLNGGSLYDYYETKDGKYVTFGGLEPQFFTNFCNTIGRPDLIAGGVAPKGGGMIKKEIREILLSKTRDEWVGIFNRTDACFEPVMTLTEVFSDPLALERGMLVEVDLPGGGKVKQIANPIKFSETPPEYRYAGVSGAMHNREVLSGLGYADAEIEEFEKTGLFK